MDQVKNSLHLQNYSPINQTSIVSIEEDCSTCLKHLVGYASPKLTPKHARSVKQSKRRTKAHESPNLEFPPPPSVPLPEHYDLSDEYSADLIDNDVPNCTTHYRLNSGLVQFPTIENDKNSKSFWKSPVEAPWDYFIDGVVKNLTADRIDGKLYEEQEVEKETNSEESSEFWGSIQGLEKGWICKIVESSTPYMERKRKVKKKSKKNKGNEAMGQASEEVMLINKLKEQNFDEEDGNVKDVHNFFNEIWIPSESNNIKDKIIEGGSLDNSCIQIQENHVSNVLITHCNEEVLDNFIENKPIHKGNFNATQETQCEIRLFSDCAMKDKEVDESTKVHDSLPHKENTIREEKFIVTSGDCNRPDNKKDKNNHCQSPRNAKIVNDFPDEYSYAYYEPRIFDRVSERQENKNKFGGRNSRYTYTTHYGTEENIYEEITEVSCNLRDYLDESMNMQEDYLKQGKHFYYGSGKSCKKHGGTYCGISNKSQSQISLNQSIVEEEVREVQSTHKRVLNQLNLTMEEMLMPNMTKEKDEIKEKKLGFISDMPIALITDLDSGFSGSSGTSASLYSSASYTKPALLRRTDLQKGFLSDNYKLYPQMLMKSKQYNTVFDNRSEECCGNHCCDRYLYLSNENDISGENILRYSSGSSTPSTYSSPNNCQRNLHSSNISVGSLKKVRNPSVKSFSFPRGAVSYNHSTYPKRLSGHGNGPSWAKRGWKKLTGFATGSTNKVNVLDEPHGKASGWEQGHASTRASSEDSWCSGSDNDLSSGDESSERSATSSTRSNGQLRQTLNKARTLCDKFRPHVLKDTPPGHDGGQPPGRLSRWFSMRRGSSNQYELDNGQDRLHIGSKMPLLSEVDEESLAQSTTVGSASSFSRRQVPPTLPPPPTNLTPLQLKRRHIIAAIVHSENSYVATLQRLVNDYKKPLEESSPTILSSSKISTLFLRLPEILQCHTLFRIALAEAIRTWDKDERIGDVFVASFSKSIVLDVYSGFINNFSIAMDLAKTEAKRKSALADFLKVKQISSHDRLSFFGLMVKPVQRFPQFILFLQDLLKHTPQGHHDRMSLQLALTQLESLAEMLNERKRESEQFQAFKEMLRHVSGKFARPSLSDSERYLLREDKVAQLEFNQNGVVTKTKNRRLLLLNDLLVCVSVAPKSSEDFTSSERLTLKWSHPVTDIEIQDTSASPTLSRLLTAGLNRSGSLKKETSLDGTTHQPVDTICQEMADLMHDYEVLSRITEWVGTLRGHYKDLTVDSMKNLLHDIQANIQKKDEVMSWVDSCCLQIVLKSKNKEEIVTFQTDNPSIKKEWITELRLAQLALDVNNSPAWEIPEEEQRPSTKMPLFVKAQNVYSSKHQTEVQCGCFYTVAINKPTASHRRARNQNYLWLCTSDGVSSHISILAQQSHQASQLKNVQAFDLVETRVTCMEFVKGVDGRGLEGDLVWMGTDSYKILIYSAGEPEKEEEVVTFQVPSVVSQIRYHCNNVFIATTAGNLLIYQRIDNGGWPESADITVNLGSDPVSCLLPINSSLYAACGKKVTVHCIYTGETQRSFCVQHDQIGNVSLMAHSGVGLWISLKNSSTICLYHTETFKHLQDINIANNVLRVTAPPNVQCSNRDCTGNSRTLISVTSLMACKGLLWVGTNVGIALTIPLPRLEGVPIISGRVNISYHAHFGAISFLLALQPKNYICVGKRSSEDKKTEKLKQPLIASPVMLRKKKSAKEGDNVRRMSKTLPRGIFSSSSSSQSSNDACDVYGLYGELMNCKDFESEEATSTDPIYESLRRSDTDLSILPGKISTLDRRLKMKTSRPRSLDLSNWSVESHTSSIYTSSGSEECVQKQKSELNRANSNNEGKPVKKRDLKRSESTGALPTSSSLGQEILNSKKTVLNKNDSEEKNVVELKEKSETKIESCKTLSKCKTMKGVPADSGRRTIITLMGGRGYVNWRQTCCNSDKQKLLNIKEPDSNDAHIVIWEMKL